MLASKSRVTNLQRNERKTLISFLILYVIFSTIIIVFSAILYYNLEKDLMLQQKNAKLQNYSNKLIKEIKFLHQNFGVYRTYPRFERFNSAIYDSEGNEIFSTLNNNDIDLNKKLFVNKNNIYYVRLLESYYLGAMYVVIELDDTQKWLSFFKLKIWIYGIVLFVILLIAGYFLLRMMLKPMKDSLYLLDRFIKDTTHELNTPISSILTNIEMIDNDKLDEKDARKINRIEIAARTMSNLYNDLTYVALGNQIPSKNEDINLFTLINERVEFFKVISRQRKILCNMDMEQDVYLYIDRIKISRLIDNLLSNAIKYNKKNGTIKVVLKENYFSIEDTGIGMREDKLSEMFDRYTRFNNSEGGFGLGLSIVLKIANEYSLDINVESKLNEGTKVTISW